MKTLKRGQIAYILAFPTCVCVCVCLCKCKEGEQCFEFAIAFVVIRQLRAGVGERIQEKRKDGTTKQKKRAFKMAPKKSTIVLNVEQFIHDIEERPAIWNRNFHCNKAFLEQMWDELSGTHKLPSKYKQTTLQL